MGMNSTKGSESKRMQSRPFDSEGSAVVQDFVKKRDLTFAQLGRILNVDPAQLTYVRYGRRPYSTTLVRLYILIQDEALKPTTDEERETYQKEKVSPPEAIAAYLEKGNIPDPKSRKPSKKKVRRKKEKASWKARPKDPQLVKVVNRFMEEHGIKSKQLAKILDVHNHSFTPVRNGRRPFSTTLARLYILINHEALKPQSKNELEAYKRELNNIPEALTVYLEQRTLPVPDNLPTKSPSKEAPPKRPPARIEKKKNAPKEDGGVPLIFSPHFDRILSGVAEVKGQFSGLLRFVLTADNFLQFKGDVSDVEIEDTKLLIQELRRRLAIFAQIRDDKVRVRITRDLRDEVNELYLTLEMIRSALPIEAAQELAELRNTFLELRITNEKKRG